MTLRIAAQPAVAGPPALPSNAMGGSAASETAASNSPASAADLGPRIAGSAAASSSADNDVVMNDASSNSSSAVAASSSSSMIVQPSSGNADILGAKLPATTASSGGTGEVPAAAAADPNVQTNKGRCWKWVARARELRLHCTPHHPPQAYAKPCPSPSDRSIAAAARKWGLLASSVGAATSSAQRIDTPTRTPAPSITRRTTEGYSKRTS